MRFVGGVVLSCVLATTAAVAEELRFEDAKAAYDRGQYAKALRVVRPLAERGDARAQHLLSVMHLFGYGTNVDKCASTTWADRSARQGYVPAFHRLAWAYFSGHGIPRDEAMAYRWALAADRKGYRYAREDLGMFGSGLSERQRMRIKASMKSWRAPDQPAIKFPRPPGGLFGRIMWWLRGRPFCDSDS